MLVGRETELRLLGEVLAEGRRVVLFGEAGVGKTALLRTAAQSFGRRLHEAGALATLSWIPYFPLRRVLGREPRDGDAAYVAREVERAVGSGILFLDDLHWADRETRAVAAAIAPAVRVVAAIRQGDPAAAEALDEVTALGFELVRVEPVGRDAAVEIVRRRNASLSAASVTAIVDRAGGNPLLLEELAAGGGPSASLRLTLAARLRRLEPEARSSMALLALAGRPLSAKLLGAGAAMLADAGLARQTRGRVEIRHALLGEAMAELLDEDERRVVHARLARALRDPGEAARHHAGAREHRQAYRKAMRAMERAIAPGEQADHLALAAASARGPEADELRVRAAETLAGVGAFASASDLLAEVDPRSSDLRARALLVRARAAIADRDLERGTAYLAEVERLASETGGSLEVEVAVTAVLLRLETNEPLGPVLERARAALAVARERDTLIGRALYAFALAGGGGEEPGELLREVVETARRDGDISLECSAADRLCNPGFADVQVTAGEMIERTRAQKLTGWERRFRCRRAGIDFHLGSFHAVYEAAEELLRVSLEPWERYLVAYYGAQAAADLGLHERASELVAELDRLASSGHESRRQALWARADTELLAGRPRQALAAADDVLAEFPDDLSLFTRLARAWACLELGRDPGAHDHVVTTVPLLAGARPELEGVSALASGRDAEAARSFARAAELWSGRHARGELRCLWAAGEALRRAGDNNAIEALLEAERRARIHEHAAYLARVERSLRLAGLRRATPRHAASGRLTAREEELLALVAEGLSNAEIARRLGIGRPTVARTVASASRKLGAETRAQAAALAVR